MAGSDIDADLKERGQDDATVFASTLMEQVNQEDISSMVFIQRDMLSRFEKTNEMLINFNILSTGRYEATLKDFQKHTQLLYEMKKDLDNVFKRIRLMKQRLEKTHPEAFAACSSIYNMISDEDDDDSDDNTSTTQSTQVDDEPKTRDTSMPTSKSRTHDPPLVTVSESTSPPPQQDQAKVFSLPSQSQSKGT